jgi:hypothetical protein
MILFIYQNDFTVKLEGRVKKDTGNPKTEVMSFDKIYLATMMYIQFISYSAFFFSLSAPRFRLPASHFSLLFSLFTKQNLSLFVNPCIKSSLKSPSTFISVDNLASLNVISASELCFLPIPACVFNAEN